MHRSPKAAAELTSEQAWILLIVGSVQGECQSTVTAVVHACLSFAPFSAQAVALGKPWVLDPVGCGATAYRTASCVSMLKLKPAVVRGNASEILALAGAAGGQPGRVRQSNSIAVCQLQMWVAVQQWSTFWSCMSQAVSLTRHSAHSMLSSVHHHCVGEMAVQVHAGSAFTMGHRMLQL